MKPLWIILTILFNAAAQAEPCASRSTSAKIILCAENGDSLSQYLLGGIYFQGDEVPRNYEKSFEWTSKAANQGVKEAQSKLGFDYYNGWGTRKNHVLAYMWWSLAIVGNEEPTLRKNLDDLEQELSHADLGKAQELALRFTRNTK
jgi:TPR repeat protein